MVIVDPPEKLVLEVEASGPYSAIEWHKNGLQLMDVFTQFFEMLVTTPTNPETDLGVYEVALLHQSSINASVIFTVTSYGELRTSTLQKQKGCFNPALLPQLQLYCQGMYLQADKLTTTSLKFQAEW